MQSENICCVCRCQAHKLSAQFLVRILHAEAKNICIKHETIFLLQHLKKQIFIGKQLQEV